MTKPHYVLLIIVCLLASCKGTQTITGTQTGTTTMLLFDGDTVGCGFFIVYKGNQDKTKTVMVSGETEVIKLSKIPKTFDIENTPGLEVRLDDYGEGKYSWLCEASVPHGHVLQRFRATSGKVTIFITREKVKGSVQHRAFAITVVLEKVTFPVSTGGSYYIEKLEMEDVVVGTQSA